MARTLVLDDRAVNVLKEGMNELRVDGSSSVSTHSHAYFAVFRGRVLLFDDKSSDRFINFIEQNGSALQDVAYSLIQQYQRTGHKGGDFLEMLVKSAGNKAPYLITGEITGDSVWVNHNSQYDVLNSNELRQLLQMTHNAKVYYDYKEVSRETPIKQNAAPDFAYHGTSISAVSNILKRGIRPNPEGAVFSKIGHDKTVFLTTSLDTAFNYGRIKSYKGSLDDRAAVLKIDMSKIDPAKIVLDFDIYNLHGDGKFDAEYDRLDKEHDLGVDSYHTDNLVTNEKNPVKYGKFGYRGIIMPSAIVSVLTQNIGERIIEKSPADFLKEMTTNEEVDRIEDNPTEQDEYTIGGEKNAPVGGNYYHVVESSPKVRSLQEGAFPDEIRLFHGTSPEAVNDILESGVIDAYQGHRHGETEGMNWFSLSYTENFSRGAIISLGMTIDQFNQFFHKMNSAEATSNHSTLDITQFDFQIERLYDFKKEALKRLYELCVEKYGNDAIWSYLTRLNNAADRMNIEHIFADTPLFKELMREIGHEDDMRREGLLESSNKFAAWFGNSVVVDRDGRPLKMYHGTQRKFDKFSSDYIGSSGSGCYEGLGFNFTPSLGRAMCYASDEGEVKEVYLRAEHPLYSNRNTITLAKLVRIIKKIDSGKPITDTIPPNYEPPMYGENWDSRYYERAVFKTARAIKNYQNENGWGDAGIYAELSISAGKEVIDVFMSLGYDSCIFYNDDGSLRTVVVFSPDQIMSTGEAGLIGENIEREVDASDVDLSSFTKKNELEPQLWKGETLDSKIRLKLLDIADDFWNYVDISFASPVGILLTGSICGFGWSDYSDIDLHLVVDFSSIDERTDFVRQYMNEKRKAWNKEHSNLTIMGYPVEVYVEDVHDTTESDGIYDLEENKWAKKPSHKAGSGVDDEGGTKIQAADIMTIIDGMSNKLNAAKTPYEFEEIHNDADSLFKKLKKLRSDSLKNGGEDSVGNIAYKAVRREGYLDKLSDILVASYDKANSITESTSLNEWANFSVMGDIELIDYVDYQKEEMDPQDLEDGYEPEYEVTGYDNQGEIMVTGSFDESELADTFGDEVAAMIIRGEGYDSGGGDKRITDILAMNSTPNDLNDVNEVNKIAKRIQTGGPSAYILIDGDVISFQDHIYISNIEGMTVGKFLELGNIRVGNGGVELIKEPTQEQYLTLQSILAGGDRDLYLDIGEYVDRHQYPKVICSARYFGVPTQRLVNDIKAYFREGIKPIGVVRESVLKEDRDYMALAKNFFGTTSDIRECGFILPDGSMLDFSGRHSIDKHIDPSSIYGRRTIDHRDISDIGWDRAGNEQQFEFSLEEFIRLGAIRVHVSKTWITLNLFVKPTPQQVAIMKRMIAYSNGCADVEIGDSNVSLSYAEYDDTNPNRIIAEIMRYFDEGINLMGNINEDAKHVLKEYLEKEHGMPLMQYFKWAKNATSEEKARDLAYECDWYIPDYIKQVHYRYPEFDEIFKDEDDIHDDEKIEQFIQLLAQNKMCEHFISIMQDLVEDYSELPAWLSVEFIRPVKNEWCIHFTKDADSIAREGFTGGTPYVEKLAYTNAGQDKSGRGYNFAFLLGDRDVDYNDYGNQAVIFRASGVLIYHYGDNQDQVIFWGPSVKSFIPIKYDGMQGDWVVEGQKGQILKMGKPSEIADWATDHLPQYRKQIMTGNNGYIPKRTVYDRDSYKTRRVPYDLYKPKTFPESVQKYISVLAELAQGNTLTEEVVADGDSKRNPYRKRWTYERNALKSFLANYGKIMTSRENGKEYKVYYDDTLSELVGINFCICVEWDSVTMTPGSVIYVRALDKFTERRFQPQFDVRGKDNQYS